MIAVEVLRVSGGQIPEFENSSFFKLRHDAGYTGEIFQNTGRLVIWRADRRMAFQLSFSARSLFTFIGQRSASVVIEPDAGRLDIEGISARDGSNDFSLSRLEVHYSEIDGLNGRPKPFILLFDIRVGEPIAESFRSEDVTASPGDRYWARAEVNWSEINEFYRFQKSWIYIEELKDALRNQLGLVVEKPFSDAW